MANEFKIKHGFISLGNAQIEGTLNVSTGININGDVVATRNWVTASALTGYATQTYVTTAISNLVAAAPGTLDTLNELAAALGDDPNFATTVTNSIAGKLPLAGGTMTGDLTVQTYLKLGAGSNGFFYSDTPGRTAFNSGDFYIQSSVNNFYNYATNQYYGNSSGNNILFRGNPLSGNNWNITASGVITATGGNSSNWNTAYSWGNHANLYIPKRTGLVTSSGILDSTALFPLAITTAQTAIGFEYNILLNAAKKGYTFTQSGTGQIGNPAGLCDGYLAPNYSGDGIDPADPFVLVIEGLPSVHTQTGGVIGWTSRYWNPTKWKLEVYDSYNGNVWRTIGEQTTSVTTKDLVIPLYQIGVSGSFTKIRLTVYESNGSLGTNGFPRWGISELFFIHPESQSTHQYLDVAWAKSLSTARTIAGVSFNGSANISLNNNAITNGAGYTTNTGTTTGSGTSNYISKWSGTTSQANSLIYDNGTNVGIGTTSPTSKLEVVGDIKASGLYYNSTSGGELRLDNSYGGGIGYYADQNGHNFYTWGSTGWANKMAITDAGNVGIGTTSPSQKLEVNGNAIIGGGTLDNPQSWGKILQVQNTGSNGAAISVKDSNKEFNISTYGSKFYISEGVDERITITSTGNVGIGTSSPGAKLDIVSTGAGSEGLRVDGANGGFAFVVKGGSDYTSHIRAGATIGVNYSTTPPSNGLIVEGNVGIGTTSPIARLTLPLEEETNYKIAFKSAGTTHAGISTVDQSGAGLYIGANSFVNASGVATYSDSAYPSSGIYFDGWYADSMVFYTAASGAPSERMRITSSGVYWFKGSSTSTGYEGAMTNTETTFDIYGSRYGGTGKALTFWATGSGESMRITSAGNVGIGTTSPSAKLHLSGSGVTELRITSTTGNTNSLLSFYESALASWGIDAGQANGSFFIKDLYNSATRLTISYTGNVGIGTTSPVTKLEVDGIIRSDRVGVASQYVQINGGDAAGPFITAAGAAKVLTIQNNSTTSSDIYFDQAVASTYQFKQASVTKMILDASGNVGIGTTSPVTKLEVDGTVTISGPSAVKWKYSDNYAYFGIGYISGVDYGFYNYNYGRADLYIQQSTGYVGIGTTSPSAKLDVNGAIRTSFLASGNAFLEIYSGSIAGYIEQKNANPLITIVNGSERMRITSAGNVGIGTTAPLVPLTVKADSGGNAVRLLGRASDGYAFTTFRNNADTATNGEIGISDAQNMLIYTGTSERMRITSTGNVSIGNTNDNYKLDVRSTKPGSISVYGKMTAASSSNSFGIQGENTSITGTAYGIGGYASGAATTNVAGIFSATGATNNYGLLVTNGNVGIGTTSPLSKLDVDGNVIATSFGGRAYPYNSILGSGADASTGTVFAGSTSGYVSSIDVAGGGATNPNTIILKTASAERMRITSSGNVGIGTTNVFSRLTTSGSLSTTSSQMSIVNTEGGHTILRTGISGISNAGFSLISADVSGTNQNTRLVVNSAGNVGIGTASPANKLVVTSDASPTSENSYAIAAASASDPAYKTVIGYDFTNDVGLIAAVRTGIGWRNISIPQGNVGIGTTSPDEKLRVSGKIKADAVYVYDGLASGQTGIGASSSGGDLRLYSNGSIGAVLSTAGNVGIGTTAPTQKLDIRGNLYAEGTDNHATFKATGGNYSYLELNDGTSNGYLIKNISAGTANNALPGALYTYTDGNKAFQHIHSASPLFTILSTGNVGIGTTAPAAKLDIAYTTNPTTATPHIILTTGGTIKQAAITAESSAVGGLVFSTGDGTLVDRMTILRSNGNVGIGTTSPSEKLQVEGKIVLGANPSWGKSLILGGNANSSTANAASIGVTNGNLHIDAAVGASATYLNYYDGTAGVAFGNGATGLVAWMGPDGDLWKGTSDNTGQKYWNAGDGSATNWNTAYGWGNHASQGYATQTYVNTAVSNLVSSAPGTLDTLNELAAALGDDPNFATTVTNSIATKLPLAGGTITGNLTVQGTTYLGNANGDETHINDILRVGATDSGDSHFYFGEGALAGSDYGSHWHWDSGYTFTWNTRNGGTDTSLFDYVTNDTTYINWRRNFHMQNREINFASQLHFNGGTRFNSYNTNYLYFQTDSTNNGGIIVRDGNASTRGFSGYFDSSGFGLLNSSGSWGIRLNPGNTETFLFYAGDWRVQTVSGGTKISGNLYTDVNYGYGLVGLYSAERYQGVFAMGDSYKLSADGTSSGSLYGIAWTHANVGGQSKSGLGHQMLIMESGTTTTAIGRGIWTNGLITSIGYGTSSNWNTAYGWGNHASAGYLTSLPSHTHDDRYYTETESDGRYVLYGSIAGSFGLNDNKLYLRTNNDNNHYIWNAADDWEEIVAYSGTGLRIASSTGVTLATFTTSGNSMNITGNAATATNVAYSGLTGTVPTWNQNTTGNAATASNLAANTSTTFKILTFTGVGGDSGNGSMPNSYAIYQQGGSWTNPYPDLCIGYHTGIKIGAYYGYNGTRFYNNSDWATEIFSVGNGDNHVRVLNNLYVTGTVTGSNLSGTNTGDQTNISGNAGSVTGLTLNSSANGINPDSVTQNQIGYNTSVSLFGQSDGGLYSSAYSSEWIHQIFGDFRTGQIAVRGKVAGTWQPWRTVIDSSNFTTYAATAAQGSNATTAYGWGNHASAGYSNASNLSSGTVPYARTNKVLPTSGNYVWNASTLAGDYEVGVQTSFVNAALGFPEYGAVLHVGARGANDAGGDFQIYCGHGSANGGNHLRFRNADNNANPSDSWTAFKIIWDSENLVNNQDNWNTAYGWGNHASAGYQLASTAITTSNIGSQSVSYASTAGNADTLDGYHETSFIRIAANSSSPTNATFAIGSASGRNFIQSHSGQPLDLNPLGNTVTVGSTLTISGTVSASNLSGTNTGDQTNISGNAATATNVAWTGVTSRPTALSQFSNDLGNYGGWLTTGGKAADSELIDGIDSSRIVYGDGDKKSTNFSDMNAANQSSGFFFYNQPTGNPFSDWTNWINVMGNSWNNNYGFQIAHAFHNDGFAVRRVTNGSFASWRTIIDSGNIGSQSVSYATTAGTASNISAYTINQSVGTGNAPTFTDVYVNDWFRNNNVNEGLYNQSSGNHFYSKTAGLWAITGAGADVELQFRSNHESTIRGYVYGDTSSNFGLLNSVGGWSVKCLPGSGYGGFLNGTWTASGDLYASGGNSTNWNTAYGWGNHASAGYLTSYTDTNTTYTAGTGMSLAGTTFNCTVVNTDTNTTYTAGSGLSLTGTVFANTAPNVVQTTVSGNAGSATVLQTARTIAGVSFNGSANISLNNNAITNGAGYITSGGRAYPRRSDGGDLNFYWSGQSGQPTWLWGGTDGANMYVYNPSNFSVNYATTAGSASSAATTAAFNDGTLTIGGGGFLTWDVGLTRNMAFFHNGSTGAMDYRTEMKFRNQDGIEYIRLFDFDYWTGRMTLNIDAYNQNNGLGNDGGDCSFAVDADTHVAAIRHSGVIQAVSDRREKHQILPIKNAVERVKKITGSTYYRTNSEHRLAGVIAQDVQEALPEAVWGSEETRYSVDYNAIIALLVQATKEQQETIDALTERIQILENK